MKKILIALLSSTILLTGCNTQIHPGDSIKIETKAIQGDQYTVSYPYIANEDAFNNEVQKKIKSITDEFVAAAKNATDPTLPKDVTSSLNVHFTTIGASPNEYASILMEINSYILGAAHPSTWYVALNYNVQTDKFITLAEAIPDLQKASNVVYQELLKEDQGRPENERRFTDLNWLKTGLEPKPDNFAVFNLTDKDIFFTFGEYQIAPYVAGSTRVQIPRKSLN